MAEIIDQSTEIDIDIGADYPPIDPSLEKSLKINEPNPIFEDMEDGEEVEKEVLKKPFSTRKEEERDFRETLSDIEKEAWDMGWRKDKFFKGLNKDGSPKVEISAEEFISKNEKYTTIANERVRKLSKEKTEAEKQNIILQKQIEELVRYNKTREEREIQSTQVHLDAEERQAIMEGDVDRVMSIRKQKEEVAKTQFAFSEPDQQQVTQFSPTDLAIFQDWQVTNSWFNRDPSLKIYASSVFDQISLENPRLSVQDRLEMVQEEVEERFSDKVFTQRRKPVSVDSGIRGMQVNKPKTISFNEIPDEAKKMCEGFIKKGRLNLEQAKKLRAEYVKEYSI